MTSDVSGDATFIGVLDSTAANITKVTFSLTSCSGDCTDFAIDTVSLNVPGGATPTANGDRNPDRHGDCDRNCHALLRPRPHRTSATATKTATATATATATGATATATRDRDPTRADSDRNGHFNCDCRHPPNADGEWTAPRNIRRSSKDLGTVKRHRKRNTASAQLTSERQQSDGHVAE